MFSRSSQSTDCRTCRGMAQFLVWSKCIVLSQVSLRSSYLGRSEEVFCPLWIQPPALLKLLLNCCCIQLITSQKYTAPKQFEVVYTCVLPVKRKSGQSSVWSWLRPGCILVGVKYLQPWCFIFLSCSALPSGNDSLFSGCISHDSGENVKKKNLLPGCKHKMLKLECVNWGFGL